MPWVSLGLVWSALSTVSPSQKTNSEWKKKSFLNSWWNKLFIWCKEEREDSQCSLSCDGKYRNCLDASILLWKKKYKKGSVIKKKKKKKFSYIQCTRGFFSLIWNSLWSSVGENLLKRCQVPAAINPCWFCPLKRLQNSEIHSRDWSGASRTFSASHKKIYGPIVPSRLLGENNKRVLNVGLMGRCEMFQWFVSVFVPFISRSLMTNSNVSAGRDNLPLHGLKGGKKKKLPYILYPFCGHYSALKMIVGDRVCAQQSFCGL